jgi:hypothetical protein
MSVTERYHQTFSKVKINTELLYLIKWSDVKLFAHLSDKFKTTWTIIRRVDHKMVALVIRYSKIQKPYIGFNGHICQHETVSSASIFPLSNI